MRGLIHTIVKYTLGAVAVFAVGPVAGKLMGLVQGPGGNGPGAMSLGSGGGGGGGGGISNALGHTGLLSVNPAMGLAVGIGCVVLAGLMGVLAARITHLRWAMLCGGAVLAWAAAQSGTLDSVLRANGPGGAMMKLAIETGVLALATAGAVVAMSLVARPSASARPGDVGTEPHNRGRAISAADGLGVGLGLLCGALGVYLVSQNMLKGQAIAGVAVGAAAAGLAARIMGIRCQPASMVLGVCLTGVVAPIVLGFNSTGVKLLLEANGGTISPLLRPMPLDWAAGALLGLPLGLSYGLPQAPVPDAPRPGDQPMAVAVS